jgi:hypothetical protein
VKALLSRISKLDEQHVDPAPSIRRALKVERTSTLNKWHDNCSDGRLMDLICEELDSRTAVAYKVAA